MDTTYNKVMPVSLGKSRKKVKNAKVRDKEIVGNDDLTIPPPPSIPPPSFILAPPSQGPSFPSWDFHGNNQELNISQPILSNRGPRIPKPSSTGTILISSDARVDFGIDNNMGTTESRQSPRASGKERKKRKMNRDQNVIGGGVDSMVLAEEAERRKKRAERFANTKHSVSSSSLDSEENFANLNAISTKSHQFDKNKSIVGRCQSLEKSYLRLTSEPNPDLVRPLNVLKKAYTMLMKKYQKNQASYQYLCDQFKSMRQDLRVQMIENQFTVKVYESHARIALENGDLGEFNQCQSRLITLFELPTVKPSFIEEFTSYRILYYMLTEDSGSMNTLRLKLMTENKAVFKNHMVQTAFKLAHARLVGDYHNFMKIYTSMKNLGKKLVDAFIEKEKLKSLVVICKSYNQIKLDFLIQEFQLNGYEELMEFFKQRGLDKYILTKNLGEENESQYLDTKACRVPVMQQYFSSKKIDIKGQQ
ncbi:hypothetical protein HG537_0B03840 [Torulaspora globosa]|uniref:SAC3/GANP/THP3 conserved domain-containing protein n=1 Tax=Torulaspora globosa TaxID=48254 RepID=A0A7H9HQU9_9SACH|nr:hypothetical protein HG537_0B03840 [Torulaspora sp. CBS 2947]